MTYKISEVAAIAGVTVRTLHHYDHIGLLRPKNVSPAGYRLYSNKDLEQLQQILFFRELDFSLEDIRLILASPKFDRKKALQSHRKLLVVKKERLERIVRSIDDTIQSIDKGHKMEGNQMFKAFDRSEIERHKEQYAEEVKKKYGGTAAFKECEKKTADYKKEDWAKISARSGEIYRKLVAAMDKGPASADAQAAVAEWRQCITDSFYNCTPEIFRGLGDLYVQDERFTTNIDQFKPGLAAFMREAMHIYCDNLSAKKKQM